MVKELPIIILGTGLAGYTLARELRKLNQEIPLVMITADDGRYYSKPQLSSALTHHKTASALGMMTAERMSAQLKITIINNTLITQIDTQSKKVYFDGGELLYSKLVFATGATPIIPVFHGSEHVVTVNNLQDYERFREKIANKKHVTIIGAGLVGCEFANDLLHGGYQVSVIALSEAPLNLLLPPLAGHAVKAGLAEAGVEWYLGRSIQNVTYNGADYSVQLSTGERLQTDILLSAIGLKPNIELAVNAGIQTNKGIAVNRYLAASVPDIYALGDCAEVAGLSMFYVMPLALGAKALASTLNGRPEMVDYPPMPIIIKTPACPVVVQPPMLTSAGQWDIIGSSPDITALFYDNANKLQGFALTGTCVEQKSALIEQLPTSFF